MIDPESTIDKLQNVDGEIIETDKLNFLISFNGKTRRIGLDELKKVVGNGGSGEGGDFVKTESVNQPNGVAGLDENGQLVSETFPPILNIIHYDMANSSVAFGPNATANDVFTTAVGYTARVLGNFSIAVGADARTNSRSASALGSFSRANYEGSTSIGYEASDTANNQVQLGNSISTTYAYGAVQDRSDRRDKTEITDTDLGLEFINALRPVKYKWDYRDDYAKVAYPSPKRTDYDTDEEFEQACQQHQIDYTAFFSNPIKDGSKTRERFHYGIIADELKETLDTLGIDFGGYQDHSICGGIDIRSVGYTELISPMIKAIQELSKQVQELKTKLDKE